MHISRAEVVLGMIRASVLILLLLTVCFVYIWGAMRDKIIVQTDSILILAGVAMTWFFRSRDDDKKRAEETKERGLNGPAVSSGGS